MTSNDAFGFYKPLMFLYILKHSQDAFPICGKVAQQEVQAELSTALADFQMQLSVHVQTMKSDMQKMTTEKQVDKNGKHI